MCASDCGDYERDVTPCSLVQVSQCLRGILYLNFRVDQNVQQGNKARTVSRLVLTSFIAGHTFHSWPTSLILKK
jgi:hypothetical protein